MSQPTSDKKPSRFSLKTAIRLVVVVNIALALAAMWVGNTTMAVVQFLCAFALFSLSVFIGALEASENKPPSQSSASTSPDPAGASIQGHGSAASRSIFQADTWFSDTDATDDIDTTPPLIQWAQLHCAEYSPDALDEGRALVAAGADPAATDFEGDNAYVVAALLSAPAPVLDVLVELGVDPTADPALLDRMFDGEVGVDTLRAVLHHGFSIHTTPSDYGSLLEKALDNSQPDEVILFMVESGADITVSTLEGETLLEKALYEEYELATVLALVPFWSNSTGTANTPQATAPSDWGLEDALAAACKNEAASDLVGPLVLAGADPFALSPSHDETAVYVLVDATDTTAILALAQALPMKSRYRLQGHVGCQDGNFEAESDISTWLQSLDDLESAWANGYGDPSNPSPRLGGSAGKIISEHLINTTSWSGVQKLLLAGADPLLQGTGGVSALDKALTNHDFHLAAMMLECLSLRQAREIITLQGFTLAHERTALAWWEVRRLTRSRYLASLTAPSASPTTA